jgi:Neuraminidase (sialidase)
MKALTGYRRRGFAYEDTGGGTWSKAREVDDGEATNIGWRQSIGRSLKRGIGLYSYKPTGIVRGIPNGSKGWEFGAE